MRLPACAGSMDHLAALAVEVGEVDRAPELRQRARLDLADPLARDAEMLAGLLERAGDAVVETVADAQDLLLALRERAEQAVELLVLELELDQALHRHRRAADVLGGEFLERVHAAVLVERLDAPEERAQALGARRRDVQLVRDLGDERVAREPGAE